MSEGAVVEVRAALDAVGIAHRDVGSDTYWQVGGVMWVARDAYDGRLWASPCRPLSPDAAVRASMGGDGRWTR